MTKNKDEDATSSDHSPISHIKQNIVSMTDGVRDESDDDYMRNYSEKTLRSMLSFDVTPCDPDILVMETESAIQWIAYDPSRSTPVFLPFLLQDWLSDDPPSHEMTEAEEAALNVAARTLRRYCLNGMVRYGFIEQEEVKKESGSITYEMKPWILDKREFKECEFLYDGVIHSRNYLPRREGFIIYDDIAKIMGAEPTYQSEERKGQAEMSEFSLPRRGPKRRFDEAEFWAIVASMAELDALPDSQAEFIRRIDEALMAEWQETPADTWLKKRAAILYKARSLFRKGNRG